jgi:hypothetical protein
MLRVPVTNDHNILYKSNDDDNEDLRATAPLFEEVVESFIRIAKRQRRRRF